MKLEIKSSDHTILEDEFGNPVFKYIGDYPADVYALIRYIKGLENQVDSLKWKLEDERTRKA